MKNKYTGAEFIFWNIYFDMILWFWYRNTLFRPLEDTAARKSTWILAAVLLAAMLLGYLTQKKNRLNARSIFLNCALGYGCYTMLAYRAAFPDLIRFLLLFVFFFILLYGFVLFTDKRECGVSRARYLRARAGSLFKAGQVVSGLCCGIMVCAMFLHVFFSSGIASAKSVKPESEPETPLFNSLGMFTCFEDGTWYGLSVNERLDVLQTAANNEAYRLGLPHELNVVTYSPSAQNELGNYCDPTRTVSVSLSHLLSDDPYSVLDTICHEAYHAYQHRMIDLMHTASDDLQNLKLFQTARQYDCEFKYYTSGTDNYSAYYVQECEVDARTYAENAVADYREKIQIYLAYTSTPGS